MRNLKIAVFHNITVDGGSKRSLYSIVEFLSQRHTVDIYNITTLKGGLFNLNGFAHSIYTFKYQELYFKKRPFSYLNMFLAFFNLYRLDRTYLRMAREIDKHNYDIVFISFCLISYFAPSLLKYLKTPKVYYCHEPARRFYEPQINFLKNISIRKKISNLLFSPLCKFYNYILKINDRRNIRHSDLVLCNSYYSKEFIYKVYGLSAKVNYLGVDTQRFKPMNLPRENLVISVGHLEPRKAHDFVIQAIAKIHKSIRPKLAIIYPIGSDSKKEYKKYLEELANENEVEVSFFEKITDEELALLYNKAKITLCAHIREPFGLIPLESMACQTPVIAIREAGLKETIIHNQTGILTERDIVKFSQAMNYLLGEEEIRIKLGKAGRQYVVDNWTWGKSINELEKNIFHILRNR